MTVFLLAFVWILLLTIAMAIGAIISGKSISGSCGGLNAVAGADKCLVCKKKIDPESPLRDRMGCPRARELVNQMNSTSD